ncbi:TPA: hypothetical protein ACJHHG_002341 [Staphylococcus pseudintermedius]|uniref:hypothetical protein n=1 Tax=Staphylococcus pseudintermedius TaxID=283734 RepID=UPI000BBB8299|nr:hypothetical protein [Staphylococcus pseudintermedius]EGQ0310510.1 hypothetical protein [Staphylococcus pseudintermedius]EGQ0372962.1 hypothetical protein [Staphylococcus pseudintermedius]EGQ1279050.1 hypothetical protein [Staphylococcus pseudintermedius]EGQ1623688.1 hypothetical protein [Staphylococcus pseudintermedius]EGQ1628376.1 hypothetical protein [Staphylococcus pseudintermedius]
MKSIATIEAEQYLYESLLRDELNVYGCHEVTIGLSPIKKGREIVDFLTYDTNNVFRAYEIKVTKEDLKSNAKLSFVGHYNYFVLPRQLYEEVKGTNLLSFNVGIVIIGEDVIKKSGRKTLSMSDNIKLLESLMQSLHRENMKNITVSISRRLETTNN